MNIRPQHGIKPVSDFRKDSARILKELRESREPILLTQRGRSVAVILDIETFEKMEYDAYLRASVDRGMADVKAGRTVSHADAVKRIRKLSKP